MHGQRRSGWASLGSTDTSEVDLGWRLDVLDEVRRVPWQLKPGSRRSALGPHHTSFAPLRQANPRQRQQVEQLAPRQPSAGTADEDTDTRAWKYACWTATTTNGSMSLVTCPRTEDGDEGVADWRNVPEHIACHSVHLQRNSSEEPVRHDAVRKARAKDLAHMQDHNVLEVVWLGRCGVSHEGAIQISARHEGRRCESQFFGSAGCVGRT